MLVAEVSGLRYFFLLRLLRFVIVLRTPPDRIPSAVRSDAVRRPPVNVKRWGVRHDHYIHKIIAVR